MFAQIESNHQNNMQMVKCSHTDIVLEKFDIPFEENTQYRAHIKSTSLIVIIDKKEYERLEMMLWDARNEK